MQRLRRCYDHYDLAETIDNPPDGMTTMKWRSLVDKWKREEWQKKSDITSKNRKQSTRVAHTGGSTSMTTHSWCLGSKLGRPATYKEVFDCMHQDKNGNFVNEKAKKVSESYDHIMHRKYGEDTMTQPHFDIDSWVEAAGPCKKGRVFGLSQHTFISNNQSSVGVSSTATSNRARQYDDPLAQKMHQLKNDMQKMSNSLEMIQQILQAMTNPHPSPVPSSSAFEYPGFSKMNPIAVPPSIPLSAP